MNAPSTVEPDKQRRVATVGIVPPEILRRKWNAIQRMIARRAYELFEFRGRLPGHQVEDWAQAESELLYPCCIRLDELADAIILRADLPGSFTADQLRVGVEISQVMIEGERDIDVICGHAGKTHATHTETRPQRIFRVYALPAEVDASRATAILLGSTVEIWLPTVSPGTENATRTSPVAVL